MEESFEDTNKIECQDKGDSLLSGEKVMSCGLGVFEMTEGALPVKHLDTNSAL